MADGNLRVGIIGANASVGWASRSHLPALTDVPGVELTAVCTTRPESAQESAQRFGARLAYHDYREMLKNPDIDAVGVIVRVPNHRQITLDAINAGKHVYTEWPLGTNTAEAEGMAALAKQKGVRTMVGLQSHFAAEVQHMKKLVADGYVGEVLSVHMTQLTPGLLSPDRTSSQTWRADDRMGANELTIHFMHVFDLLCAVLGEVESVSSVVTTQAKQWHESDTGRDVEVSAPDNVLLSGRMRSGAVVSVHVASVPHHAPGHQLQVYGREGTMTLTSKAQIWAEQSKLIGGRHDDKAMEEIPTPEPDWVSRTEHSGAAVNIAKAWHDFAEAIASGTEVTPNFEDALRRHQLIDAIRRASDTGAVQQV